MNSIEFAKKCQPYNKMYYELFGEVPVHYEYIATQDQYFDALKKSVEQKVKIEKFLKKLKTPRGKDLKI